MYDYARSEIRRQLRSLWNSNSTSHKYLKKVWSNTRLWNSTQDRLEPGIVIPYVGSGLNKLIKEGIGSWEKLVEEVSRQLPNILGTKHQIKRSGLTMPQQLEIYLREALKVSGATGRVFAAFQRAFQSTATPSSVHKRLVEMFPVLVTTNYNDILEIADEHHRKGRDITERNCVDLNVASIYHLHGYWDRSEGPVELERRIFAGVGGDESVHPCLVLTENQYHRIYESTDFIGALKTILGPPNVLLFLGASLAADEAGIHHILTARQLAEGDFAGLYVGIDLDPIKRQLLELRGIQCINLSRQFGYSIAAMEALFHALFDELDETFNTGPRTASPPSVNPPTPDILCTGLASWNRIFSLGNQRFVGTETSYTIPDKAMLEEPGGQHLIPALHLVNRGHKVALAATTGDDDYGDAINAWITANFDRINATGLGDLIRIPSRIDGCTRLTTGITFGDTRVIFDYDSEGRGKLEFDESAMHWDFWGDVKALYLGCYDLEFEKKLLMHLLGIKWAFFETGSLGPKDEELPDALWIASRCTHVLSSSGFALRLTKRLRITDKRDMRLQQSKVHQEPEVIAREASELLWPDPNNRGTLVIVMGGHGSAVLERGAFQPIPAVSVQKGAGRNWLGCGDLFRAEFIHGVMGGQSSIEAANVASEVVARKIKRMSQFPI